MEFATAKHPLTLEIFQQPEMEFSREMIDEDNIINFALTLNEENYSKLLAYLSDHYHNGTGIIPDDIYDQLTDIYETKYGAYNVIGAEVSSGEKVTLPFFLASLDKIKKEQDLNKWLNTHPGPYLVQDKIDGLTILFHSTVVNGRRTTKIYTRGSGVRGRDVTHLLPHLVLPNWLKYNLTEIPYIGAIDIAIRGELAMTKEVFNRLGGDASMARNSVSGIVNRTNIVDTNIISMLSYYAYRIIGSGLTPSQEINTLMAIGFDVASPVSAPTLSMEILENYFKSRKETSLYDIDGLVIYQDIVADYPTDRNPRHVVAFKVQGETGITKVTHVEWTASKDGKLAPVIHYEPIKLSGAILSKVSGYNARYIVNNNIGPGAEIIITRSGDVIPKILTIIKGSPTGPDLPNRPYSWNETQVDLISTDENDFEVFANKLKYFLDTLEIMGFGPERIKLLVKAGVRDISTLLNITPEQIAAIPGIGPVLSTQLYNDLQGKIKNVALPVIMVASGLFPGIGVKRMEAIIERYPNLLEYADIDPATVATYIRAIKGFNELADNVAGKLKTFRNWLRANPSITVKEILPPSETTGALQGMKVVFSGPRNKQLEQQIKAMGGEITNSVTKNTTYLIMADVTDIKGKGEKAMRYGVPIISHQDFITKYIN